MTFVVLVFTLQPSHMYSLVTPGFSKEYLKQDVEINPVSDT